MTIDRQLPDGTRYASISEQVLDDTRISWFDKCVLAQLLTKTADWKVVSTYLATKMNVNERTIRRSLKALELAGYAQPIYSEPNGVRYRSDTHVTATPRTSVSKTPDISVQDPRTSVSKTPDISVQDPGHRCPPTESVLRLRYYGSAITASEVQNRFDGIDDAEVVRAIDPRVATAKRVLADFAAGSAYDEDTIEDCHQIINEFSQGVAA